MIANISVIAFILSNSDEATNSGTLQKGTAISRIDNEDKYQIYKYHNFLPIQNDSTDDNISDIDNESEIIQPFKEEKVYLITGKFSVNQDDSLNINVTTNLYLPIDKEDIPVSKPNVNLLGKTLNFAELTEMGYNLPLQVKPYLSKDRFDPFTVNLVHPPNGRFQNALIKAKKNSTVHTTGIAFLIENKLYCEILEFQFVAAKFETDNSVVVPWKSKYNTSNEKQVSSPKSKSTLEQRIALIQQNVAMQPPPQIKQETSNRKGKRKVLTTKLEDISKSLLIQNNNDQQEIKDNEETSTENEQEALIDESASVIKEENENTPKRGRRAKRRKLN